MKYKERKEIIQKGMSAMLEEILEELPSLFDSRIEIFEKISYKFDKNQFNSQKDSLKRNISRLGDCKYSSHTQVAQNYIETAEQDKKYLSIIKNALEKVNRLKYKK